MNSKVRPRSRASVSALGRLRRSTEALLGAFNWSACEIEGHDLLDRQLLVALKSGTSAVAPHDPRADHVIPTAKFNGTRLRNAARRMDEQTAPHCLPRSQPRRKHHAPSQLARPIGLRVRRIHRSPGYGRRDLRYLNYSSGTS